MAICNAERYSGNVWNDRKKRVDRFCISVINDMNTLLLFFFFVGSPINEFFADCNQNLVQNQRAIDSIILNCDGFIYG